MNRIAWRWLWYLPWHWMGHFGMEYDYRNYPRVQRPRLFCQWCAGNRLREWYRQQADPEAEEQP